MSRPRLTTEPARVPRARPTLVAVGGSTLTTPNARAAATGPRVAAAMGPRVAAAMALGLCGCVGQPAPRPADEPSPATTDPAATTASLPAEFEREGRRFELAWVDDFAGRLGPSTRGDWTFDTNLAWLDPANVRVADDALELWLTPRGDRPGERAYLGAEYARTGAITYGRFVTRVKPAAPPGVITSFFTAYYDFEPTYTRLRETAEIDIEFVGTTREVQFALHFVDAGGEKREVSETVPLDFDAGDAFHVWEIEWLPEHVAFFVDGRQLHRFTDPEAVAEQAHPQEVRANVWISSAVGWAGAFDERALPVQSRYDYVAAYRLVR